MIFRTEDEAGAAAASNGKEPAGGRTPRARQNPRWEDASRPLLGAGRFQTGWTDTARGPLSRPRASGPVAIS
jgi:hypothetical protein